jgi:hypothetical protein
MPNIQKISGYNFPEIPKENKLPEAQNEFVSKLVQNLENTISNRAEVLKTFTKCKESLSLSAKTQRKIQRALESRVERSYTRVFGDATGFAKNSNITDVVLKSMTEPEKKAFVESLGCRRAETGSKVDKFSGAVNGVIRFLSGKTNELKVSQCDIGSLPGCVFNDRLEKLDCSYNSGIEELPAESIHCLNLRSVDLTETSIKEFNFTGSRRLEKVNLTHSTLKSLSSRSNIAKGLPLNTPVIIEGLDSPDEGWPKNVTHKILSDRRVKVTVFQEARVKADAPIPDPRDNDL